MTFSKIECKFLSQNLDDDSEILGQLNFWGRDGWELAGGLKILSASMLGTDVIISGYFLRQHNDQPA